MKNPAFVGALGGTVLGIAILKAFGVEIVPVGGIRSGVGITLIICLLTGAGVVPAMARGFRGSSSGFWQTTVGRYLIGRMAGTAVGLGLAALLWKPAVYTVVYGLIAARYIAGWDVVAALWPALPWMPFVVSLGGAWFLRTPAKIIIGKGSSPLRRWYRSLPMGGGGSAGFAGICEEWANRWKPGRLFLGHSLYDRKWPIGVKDDRMVTVLGANGSGKDETVIIPNLLQYAKGSVFVIDIKGQDAAVTADARRRMGQAVHVLDPFGTLKKGTAHLNPLDMLDPESDTYVENIYTIVDALVIAGNEHNGFWSDNARTVIAGAIDLMVRRRGDEFVPPEDLMEEEPVDD